MNQHITLSPSHLTKKYCGGYNIYLVPSNAQNEISFNCNTVYIDIETNLSNIFNRMDHHKNIKFVLLLCVTSCVKGVINFSVNRVYCMDTYLIGFMGKSRTSDTGICIFADS